MAAKRMLRTVAETALHRPARSARHREHRRERLSRRRDGCRDADQERRHRHVPGQGERPAGLQVLQAGHVRCGRWSASRSRRVCGAPSRGASSPCTTSRRSISDRSASPAPRPCCGGRIPYAESVPPAEFIPVAEDCGLIVPIGRWVLREACRQARAWLEEGLPATTMAVNISAVEFGPRASSKECSPILEETGLDPQSLELELTESVLMKRVESDRARCSAP